MTREEAISHIRDILAENNSIKPSMVVFELEKEALYMAIKALEQQPNRCDSCIHSEEQDGSNCYECVKGMADNFEAQQPKTAHWIRVTDKTGHLVWECDKCGWQQRYSTNFCPDCGARMIESEE